MITLCVPTRNRTGRFREMVESATATALNRIEIVARIDEDQDYPELDSVKYVRGQRPLDRRGNVRMGGLWTEAARAGSGDIFMLCGDDVVFMTEAWDISIQAAFDSIPDRIAMVYASCGEDPRPLLPFISKEWLDTAGFIPDDIIGWFADDHVWHIAAELDRVIYLPDVLIRHDQVGMDQTYADAAKSRERAGGLNNMRAVFYDIPHIKKRDELVAKLRVKLGPERVHPEPVPQWMEQSLNMAATSREHERLIKEDTLVVVHCWAGDKDLVKYTMPIHKASGAPVLVLSPEDSPVRLRGVECRSAGQRGYFGQVSLDRQRAHLELLLEYPQTFFLLNDADSMCLTPFISRYLYEDSWNRVWSNEVTEWRPHRSPYPKIAMQPPYFLRRETIKQLLSVAGREQVRAHPVTPFIDWYMLALSEESRVQHRTFPNGSSFPAWRRNHIGETVTLGHEPKHEYVEDGAMRGDLDMENMVLRGSVFVHSVKHKPVIDMLVKAHEEYVDRGSPPINTMTIQDYLRETQQREQNEAAGLSVREQMSPMQTGDTIRIQI